MYSGTQWNVWYYCISMPHEITIYPFLLLHSDMGQEHAGSSICLGSSGTVNPVFVQGTKTESDDPWCSSKLPILWFQKNILYNAVLKGKLFIFAEGKGGKPLKMLNMSNSSIKCLESTDILVKFYSTKDEKHQKQEPFLPLQGEAQRSWMQMIHESCCNKKQHTILFNYKLLG